MAAGIAQSTLILAGVAVVLLSCVGLLVGDSFDRLHYLGPAAVMAPCLIAAAVIISFSSVESVIKILLLLFALLLTSPVLTHATGESGFSRRPTENDSEDEKPEKA